MKLYFNPLACSLASRIVTHELGLDVTFVEVNPYAKTLADGSSYRVVHPLGLVPVLEDAGRLVTENAAVLTYLGDQRPDVGLVPRDAGGRTRLASWLSFVGTELHKGVYAALLDRASPDGAKQYALGKAPSRLAWVDAHLRAHEYLVDGFGVADAYLFTVLNWTQATPVDLKPYAAIRAYQDRLRTRPSVDRALREELPLYRAEMAAHRAI